MNFDMEDEFETHQSQRILALTTIDELTSIKLDLLDAGKQTPRFINNAIFYLKKKYVTDERTISQLLIQK
ncbi:hypothetical protein [Leptospira sp. GIMC2001]|uniref:hypothetical protein n=1 Tax=Leptospira sp. GIMC2001 TaxID=1513297 RepID=UPI002349E57D|nr:hypothetical protein [Leptospira sp. GIMC2001]WCL49290.1 hypothetical protein O4O04_18660 [Leptospira sp. GIMC2001]